MEVVMVGNGVGTLDGVVLKNVSASVGVYVYYYAQGTLSLYNMSFAGLTQAIYFLSYYGATVNLYNCTISTPYEFAFNGTTYVRLVIQDPIPPSVNLFAPLDGSRFNSSVVRLWGNAFDVGSGMDFVEASADGGLNWLPSDAPLPRGGMEITLEDGTPDL